VAILRTPRERVDAIVCIECSQCHFDEHFLSLVRENWTALPETCQESTLAYIKAAVFR
jgi:hypothetical protein